jgi:hypothetical protein
MKVPSVENLAVLNWGTRLLGLSGIINFCFWFEFLELGWNFNFILKNGICLRIMGNRKSSCMAQCIESQNSDNSLEVQRGVEGYGFSCPKPKEKSRRKTPSMEIDSDVGENLSDCDKNPTMYQSKFLISSIAPGINQKVLDLYPESDFRNTYSNTPPKLNPLR